MPRLGPVSAPCRSSGVTVWAVLMDAGLLTACPAVKTIITACRLEGGSDDAVRRGPGAAGQRGLRERRPRRAAESVLRRGRRVARSRPRPAGGRLPGYR